MVRKSDFDENSKLTKMSSSFPSTTPAMTLRFGALPSGDEPVLIVGMFTASYVKTAERLLASLRKLNLPHALFEVPTVHRSISPKGTLDPIYTKANFIWHARELAKRPVLYLDVDTVIRRNPELITQILSKGHDFAILNWLSQKSNDAWIPVPPSPGAAKGTSANRYFQFSHSIDMVSEDQIVCSGAVQLWGNTEAATGLLAGWHDTILKFPGVADDQCLDFAFNNRLLGWDGRLRPFWLPKSYARYAWWIFDEPIIDHPDFPYSGSDWKHFDDAGSIKRLYRERLAKRTGAPPVPRDGIVDVKTGDFLRMKNNQLVPVGKLPMKRWVQG